ncbi:hypothetical protein HGO97_017515 [Faecalicatena sp. AGMB00832]|uniref:Uncharacterized protein n=1 Tax=Faecalicatena faecalis TaxID=2726362 RepID=A0ABS6D805_9FIRM|nr:MULTISPECIES: hypothetical protein [Faecalicatena]MBU3877604.1 hypothetical protein [Faecalicatena faecalis]MCI6463911.1 hypothetical protein [Faecalicatena sp.]MDY5620811.1 hypothetical protein [Lachnospiraceae bacterium]
MSNLKNNCIEMYLREDIPRRPGRAGTWILGQEFKEQEYFEEAPNMVEILMITGNYMMMNGFPEGFQKRTYNMGDHKGGPFPKYNKGCDKTMIFSGTNMEDLRDLGAHVEFHLGEGEDEVVFEFDSPRAVFIPQNVRYGPIYITDFKSDVMVTNVYTVNSKAAAQVVNDFEFVGDDAKIKKVIGNDLEAYKKFYGSDPVVPMEEVVKRSKKK